MLQIYVTNLCYKFMSQIQSPQMFETDPEPFSPAIYFSDNLKKRQCSSKTFYPDTILGMCYIFPAIHIIPLFYSQTISLED
jgi:hypothetical protein